MTRQFEGFAHGQFGWLPLPPGFFSQWLPLIDDVDELKLTLFCLYALAQQPKHAVPYLRRRHLSHENSPMATWTEEQLEAALARCVVRGTLLVVEVVLQEQPELVYFINTPRGRSAVQQVLAGRWRPHDEGDAASAPVRPNVYALYEQHIGLLTPLIADELKDAQEEFPSQWLEDAIKIAAENNKRHWKYVRGILNRWKIEGRHHEAPARPNLQDGTRFISGKYADFIES